MNNSFIDKNLLKKEGERFFPDLSEEAVSRFDEYARLLVEWNEKINLTAITDPQGIVMKHFVDSLAVFSGISFPEGAKVIDVGTGAGFPGLPMLIARPDLNLTFLDSTKKKLTVIENILTELGLSGEILHERAEAAGQNKAYRESFDFATARAVSSLRELSEYCIPFLKVGGHFISLKSAKTDEEITEGKKAIRILGGSIEEVKSFEIPDCGERTLVLIKKISKTSDKYPRPSAKIAKNPIK